MQACMNGQFSPMPAQKTSLSTPRSAAAKRRSLSRLMTKPFFPFSVCRRASCRIWGNPRARLSPLQDASGRCIDEGEYRSVSARTFCSRSRQEWRGSALSPSAMPISNSFSFCIPFGVCVSVESDPSADFILTSTVGFAVDTPHHASLQVSGGWRCSVNLSATRCLRVSDPLRARPPVIISALRDVLYARRPIYRPCPSSPSSLDTATWIPCPSACAASCVASFPLASFPFEHSWHFAARPYA